MVPGQKEETVPPLPGQLRLCEQTDFFRRAAACAAAALLTAGTLPAGTGSLTGDPDLRARQRTTQKRPLPPKQEGIMMKRTITMLFTLCLALSLLAGCGAQTGEPEQSASQPQESAAGTGAPENTEQADEGEDLTGQTLMIYCGAGMQEPFQEIADRFQEETGCTMNVTFANAAQIQTQIQESQQGDFFIAGSADEVKPVSDFVSQSKDLVKHIPVLAVAEGNPLGITGIASLGTSDVRTVIGDPESTPIGKIAQKAFSDFGVTDTVNLVATTTTAPQLATVISLGEADAAIVWKENCNVDGVEICDTADMDGYVKTIPSARLTFSEGNAAAQVFSEYLDGETAQEIWMSYGYELAG